MPPLQSARILDQLRERIGCLYCSLRTEEAYVYRAKASSVLTIFAILPK